MRLRSHKPTTMGIIRFFTGQLPLSPSEKRVMQERTGYSGDWDKLFKRWRRKQAEPKVQVENVTPCFAKVKVDTPKGSVLIKTAGLDYAACIEKYQVAILSSDGTIDGQNAEKAGLRRVNGRANRVTLSLPLKKNHGYNEVIGLYPGS